MLIGCVRISPAVGRQGTGLLVGDLVRAGVNPENICQVAVSKSASARPGLDQCLKALRSGGKLVVRRLDRLAGSPKHLPAMVGTLNDRNVELRSLKKDIDTSTPTGRLVLRVFGTLAEFERYLFRERVQAGLDAARARGRKGGRPANSVERLSGAAAAKKFSTVRRRGVAREQSMSLTKLYRYIAPDGWRREPLQRLLPRRPQRAVEMEAPMHTAEHALPMKLPPADFSVFRIAACFARLPRWLGRTRDPATGYPSSAARHSAWCVSAIAQAMPGCGPQTLIAALMHDARVARLGDVPVLVKPLTGLSARENEHDQAVANQVPSEAGRAPDWKAKASAGVFDAADRAAASVEARWLSGPAELKPCRRAMQRVLGDRPLDGLLDHRLRQRARSAPRPDALDVVRAATLFLHSVARLADIGNCRTAG